jgi:hypothetical protein
MFGLAILTILNTVTVATIGEGYSSSEPGAPIRAGRRAFTIYTHQEACEKAAEPARIVAEPIELVVGDKFALSDPVVAAFDYAGNFVPDVPLEIFDPDTTVKKLRRELHTLQQDYIAVEPGQKIIHFRATCTEPPYITGEMVITIREPGG